MNITQKARLFAIAAHSAIGQVRKYTLEPYWYHPEEVANIVMTVDHTDEMIAAAYLHDVLEDTKVLESTLRQEFGDTITDMVVWLTDVSKPEDGNRATRKAIDRYHSADAPGFVQTIKIADIISNIKSIAEHDKDFAVVYLPEKLLQLDVLTHGDTILMSIARDIIMESGIIYK